jgi:hypothetical protein
MKTTLSALALSVGLFFTSMFSAIAQQNSARAEAAFREELFTVAKKEHMQRDCSYGSLILSSLRSA